MFIQDPDYARIFTKFRCIAWSHGYALTVHGSRCRDLDLIAIPWTEECTASAEILLMHLLQSCKKHGLYLAHEEPTEKPHGRLTYTLCFKEFGDPRWIDLSIMPRSELNDELENSVITEEMLLKSRPSSDDMWHWAANLNAMMKHGYCKECGLTPNGCEREGCKCKGK